MDPDPLEGTRIGICLFEHLAAVACSITDPAGEEAGVAGRECALELLDPTSVLGERLRHGLGVLEQDVDPDARVSACHAGHVTQRAAGDGQGVVTIDP